MNKLDAEQTIALIQNITHQAINPLSGVVGTLDNIISGAVPEHKREQRLQSARGQLEYTVSLIRNLSFFAEYASDTTADDKKKISSLQKTVIPQAIIESAQFFQEQGNNKNIKIELINKREQNCIKGNPELLKQVFMNIFDNGIKYGDNNSVITIKNWIQIDTNILFITIEGKSTPFDDSDDIFAVGTRSKDARNKTSSGSGLGLHICKLIVEKVFNGTISARYTKAGMALFEIKIPGGFK